MFYEIVLDSDRVLRVRFDLIESIFEDNKEKRVVITYVNGTVYTYSISSMFSVHLLSAE